MTEDQVVEQLVFDFLHEVEMDSIRGEGLALQDLTPKQLVTEAIRYTVTMMEED